jgi:hypothetical protein
MASLSIFSDGILDNRGCTIKTAAQLLERRCFNSCLERLLNWFFHRWHMVKSDLRSTGN